MRPLIVLGVTTDGKTVFMSLTDRDNNDYRLGADSTPPSSGEFQGDLPRADDDNSGGWSRRNFLKMAGFGAAGAAATACSRGPAKQAIPLLVPHEDVVPGVPVEYATTCGGCAAGCGLLAQNRDGRPTKLEGYRSIGDARLRSHPISGGGTCPVGQAELLSLYDSQRFKSPRIGGADTTWAKLDAAVIEGLKSAQAKGAVVVLTGTLNGPTTRARLDEFLGGFSNSRHVVYDAAVNSSSLDAHLASHGKRALPRYRLDRARCVVSFDADFLGSWVSPVEFTDGWSQRRDASKTSEFMFHAQVESRLSLTGSNADQRIAMDRAGRTQLLVALCGEVAALAGVKSPVAKIGGADTLAAKSLAKKLYEAKGESLLILDDPSVDLQILVNFVNETLGNYGKTLDLAASSNQVGGSADDMARLTADIREGRVGALIMHGVNPVHDQEMGIDLAAALERIPLVLTTSGENHETARACKFIAPAPHFLESWDDAEPVEGILVSTQPTISPLNDHRSFRESLGVWSGKAGDDAAFRRDFFAKNYLKRSGAAVTPQVFFDRFIHDGFLSLSIADVSKQPAFQEDCLKGIQIDTRAQDLSESSLELILHRSYGVGAGEGAHNAWLQEMPDPITKGVWSNVAAMATATAAALDITEGDEVEVRAGDAVIRVPAHIQPGQRKNTVAVGLGYGRVGTNRFAKVGPEWWEGRLTGDGADVIGANAALLRGNALATVKQTGRRVGFATTQEHHSLHVPKHLAPQGGEVRPMVKEVTVAAVASGHVAEHGVHHGHGLWKDDHKNGHPHWGLNVDLTKCTGCSACVLSCQIENNVPVVGEDEVRRHREMHWIRIDRYYAGEDEDVDVVHQPMMCQHCDNAPCETVCPVLATVHSEEGLNTQVYNRCVGTRYCANNCPYKTRRFNWFDYPHEDHLQNMALNPDVTVRSRGVMEKCTFCVQRIQAAKAEARRTGKALDAIAIEPACVQACPANAITFGNVEDEASEVAKAHKDDRTYQVLGELNVRPSVDYQMLVRNRESDSETKKHG